MLILQAKLLALAAIIVASLAAANTSACSPEPCYTVTAQAILNCPMLPALTTVCVVPDCILITTTTIPGPNPACPTTPTVTASGSCPTEATCRHGCEVYTSTVTGPAWSCAFGAGATSSADVSWYRARGRRGAESAPTARAILAERAPDAEHSKSCESTTTVTRPLPCPLLVCPENMIVCPLAAGESVTIEERDVATTTAGCPVTVTATRKCPTCGTSCPPIPITA